MKYAGLDIHKRVVEAVVLDARGRILQRARFDLTPDILTTFARDHLGHDCDVALEATTNTWAVVELLQPLVGRVVVSNPLRTKAIATAKVKTDKVDALVLAQLLRADYLPAVWIPDAATRQTRQTTSRRASLVHDRTAINNRIHAILHQRLLQPPVAVLFSKRGLAWLRSLRLDPVGQSALDSELRLLESGDREIELLHGELSKEAYGDPRCKLLMTLPGVDVACALTLLATLGDISRFRNGDAAASYIGIVPSTRQSADKCYHGPITKHGKAHTRWLLVQAAQHLANHPGPLGEFFRRLSKKKNRNIAVVATARKLVTIAFHMLKNNEPYRYAVPRSVETKLAKLRVNVTKEKRRGGLPKGSKRPAAYGSGQRTRPIPALGDVYAREQLPPCKPRSSGETKMLAEKKLTKAMDGLLKAHREPRRKAAQLSDQTP